MHENRNRSETLAIGGGPHPRHSGGLEFLGLLRISSFGFRIFEQTLRLLA